jgi:hypothetical protein
MRTPVSLRLNEQELSAIRQAAADDKRETTVMARLILTDWLIAKGYLQQEQRR